MAREELPLSELSEIVAQFAHAVFAQAAARDAKTANKWVKKYLAAFDALCAHGDSGREALTALFEHRDPAVRIASAAFLLRFAEERATRVLEEESRRQGPTAFRAAQALARWRDGSWDLDPG